MPTGRVKARMRQNFRVVESQNCPANMRISGNHSIGKSVVCSARVRFVPTSGKFITQAQRNCQLGTDAKNIFGVKRCEQRTPIQRSWSRVVQERRRSALQKGRQAGKSGLSSFANSDAFVGPETQISAAAN